MLHQGTIRFEYIIEEEAVPSVDNEYITFYLRSQDSYGEELLTNELVKAAQSLGIRIKDDIVSPDPRAKFETATRIRSGLFTHVGTHMRFTPVFLVPRAEVKENFSIEDVKSFKRAKVAIPLDCVVASD